MMSSRQRLLLFTLFITLFASIRLTSSFPASTPDLVLRQVSASSTSAQQSSTNSSTAPISSSTSTQSASNSSNGTSSVQNSTATPASSNSPLSTSSATLTNSTTTPTATAASIAQQNEDELPLHTILDPAFGFLGALLILSGLLMAFVGQRISWMICIISGFYLGGIFVLSFILRFGVAKAVFAPSHTVRGLFLLACLIGGGITGILLVIFRTGGLLFTAGLGGFALGLALQACKHDGVISTSTGLRWLLYVGLSTVAFCLACHPKLQLPTLIFSTAITGATALVLGVDCFTRENLKEFYVRNLGFDDIFEKRYPTVFANHHWHISQACIIELGVIVAVTFMGIGLQTRMWAELKASFKHMRSNDEERRLQSRARRAAKRIYASAQRDLEAWEERHGYKKTSPTEGSQREGTARASTAARSAEAGQMTLNAMPSSPAFEESKPFIGLESPMTLHSMEKHGSSTPTFLRGASEAISLTPADRPGSGILGYFDHPGATEQTAQSRPPKAEAPTGDAQKLQDEINAIRRSIHELSTSIAPSSPTSASNDRSQSPVSRRERASSDAGLLAQQARSMSPWLTDDRTRSRSVTASSRPLSIAALDFEEEALRTASPPTRITPVDERVFHGEDCPHPSSMPILRTDSSPAVMSPYTTNRPLSQNIDQSSLAMGARHTSGINTSEEEEEARRRRRSSQQNASASRRSSAIFLQHHISPSPAQQEKIRTVVDTPEAAEERYKTALGRGSRRSSAGQPSRPPSSMADKRRSTSSAQLFQNASGLQQLRSQAGTPTGSRHGGVGDNDNIWRGPSMSDKRDSIMSLSELQDRHKSRLSALQRPTSMRIDEEASLQEAKEAWERRVRMEKRAWERDEKKRVEEEKAQKKALASSRRSSTAKLGVDAKKMKIAAGEAVVSDQEAEEEDDVPLEQLNKDRRRMSSGATKAMEWRKSLMDMPPPPSPGQGLSRPPLAKARTDTKAQAGQVKSKPLSPDLQPTISSGAKRNPSAHTFLPPHDVLQQSSQQQHRQEKRASSSGIKPLLDFRTEELRSQNQHLQQRQHM